DRAVDGPGVEGRGQKIRVVGRHLPEQRQRRLVRQHHLPRRLDDLGDAGQEMPAEVFADQPFPRVQLEQHADALTVEIEEVLAVPTNILDGDARGVEAGLHRGVAQILDRAVVLDVILHGGEIDALATYTEI